MALVKNPTRHMQYVLVAFFLISAGCGESPPADISAPPDPEFVGSNKCQSCHESQFRDWQTSHHQAAMQIATEDTVLGDFSNATFDYFSTRTEFLSIDGEYIVRTENASGELQDFEVTHTFGVEPLQQYLVEFPSGRKQALPFLWDTTPASEGGQRWFHLYPDEYIEPGDELHWTGPNFNWNFSCAECHSTDLRMGYDASSDTFETTWSEISVGCEACHGPGSKHVQQATGQKFDDLHGLVLSLDDQQDANWVMNVETGIAERSEMHGDPQQQPESCGRCHSRRSVVAPEYEYGKLLTQTHMPSLLDDGLYFADGQIQDEVYVYGSFLQSKMYRAGVTCSDCHNPHSGELLTGSDSNTVCAQCHLPSRFATTDHRGQSSGVADCVDCHMKARTYMGVDARRDHYFRVPSAADDRAITFAAARTSQVNDDLLKIFNNVENAGIVRASALTRFQQPLSSDATAALGTALNDPDPLVRIGALRALQQMPPEVHMIEGTRLLDDPVRSVRFEAARTYAELADLFEIHQARAFQRAADELRQTLAHNGSRAESHAALASFEMMLRNNTQAVRHYEDALLIDPDNAAFYHLLGLAFVRTGNGENALQSLQKAMELDTNTARYAYVFGVALNSLGRTEVALTELAKSRQQFPDDFDIGWALATMLRDAGNIESALQVALEMQSDFPDDENIRALLASLQQRPTAAAE